MESIVNEHQDLKSINRSIVEGYVPVSTERLFETLCDVTNILDEIDVPYTITGGTLLGAVRNGDILPNDTDWDLEILDSGIDEILQNTDAFKKKGLKVQFPLIQDVNPYNNDGPKLRDCERRIMKVYDNEDNFYGDLFIYNLFSDGMLRRISVDNNAYFNAKMTFPYWFFENREKIKIRGKKFSCYKYPKIHVERIYGPRWKTPMSRHAKIPGYNFAGAYTNADVESGMNLALQNGWVPYYPDAHRWPMPIKYTSTDVSAKWIDRHEHVALTESFIQNHNDLSLEELNSKLLLIYRAEISRLNKEIAKQNKLIKRQKNDLSKSYRYKIKNIFKAFLK